MPPDCIAWRADSSRETMSMIMCLYVSVCDTRVREEIGGMVREDFPHHAM